MIYIKQAEVYYESSLCLTLATKKFVALKVNPKMCENISLWCSYQTISFKVKQHSIYPCFAILTAFNPRSIVLNEPSNILRNEILRSQLEKLTKDIQPVICHDLQGCWLENSFLTAISLEQACGLARQWQQNAIYWGEYGKLYLVPVLMEGVTRMKLGEIKDFFYTE
ncbi:DUF3293 domain-containing protein [uncultured Photobacterium sp.]|uniref:DUF3293 domain-containing protein n=1 Tax=uncultured Photobacterium sp. TaxID=173973 RepID=UPI00261A03FD|nr:DUF3293 domain-containing protein [uncultured Photobacterium sp.]